MHTGRLRPKIRAPSSIVFEFTWLIQNYVILPLLAIYILYYRIYYEKKNLLNYHFVDGQLGPQWFQLFIMTVRTTYKSKSINSTHLFCLKLFFSHFLSFKILENVRMAL